MAMPHKSLDADVLVAGGGPAGAALAAKLAAAGVDVLVVERQRFPRDKVCGDFVGPVALAELTSLGVPVHELGAANVVRRAALMVDGEHQITESFPAVEGLPNFGRVIPRMELDAAIFAAARRAGARALEGTTVTSALTRDGLGEARVRDARGERTLRARYIVGADGSASAVARALRGAGHPRKDMLVAVRAYVEQLAGGEDRCDLYFSGDTFPGYTWVFPTGGGGANVGIGMMVETVPPTTEHLRNLLLGRIRNDAVLRERLRDARFTGKIVGWPLATYNPNLPLTAGAIVLTGDAGGLINPLNGEGIHYAVLSARWAATALLTALDTGDSGALAAYERRVRAELGHDMALARVIVRSIANRSLNGLWLHMLRSFCRRAKDDPRYAHVTGGILAGLVPARDVLAPQMLLVALRGILEESMHVGVELAAAGPFTAASRGLSAASAALRECALLLDHGQETFGWARDLLSDAIDLGAESGRVALTHRTWSAQANAQTQAR
jgi:geranylgeranyl reductase family protein